MTAPYRCEHTPKCECGDVAEGAHRQLCSALNERNRLRSRLASLEEENRATAARLTGLLARWDDDVAKMERAAVISEGHCVGSSGPIRASGATSAACARELRAALRGKENVPSRLTSLEDALRDCLAGGVFKSPTIRQRAEDLLSGKGGGTT